jgi:hypothetical protein
MSEYEPRLGTAPEAGKMITTGYHALRRWRKGHRYAPDELVCSFATIASTIRRRSNQVGQLGALPPRRHP